MVLFVKQRKCSLNVACNCSCVSLVSGLGKRKSDGSSEASPFDQ